jgi:hypothetical protein
MTGRGGEAYGDPLTAPVLCDGIDPRRHRDNVSGGAA